MQVAPILDRMLRNLGRFTRPRELEKEPPSSPSDKKADFVLQYEVDKEDRRPSLRAILLRGTIQMYVYTKRYTLRGLRLKELLETAARPKSYRPPVTIMAGDKDDWYYGILEIDGFVWVENHQVDQASLQEFPEEKMEVNPKKFTPSFTRTELQNNFETWKKDFAKIKMRIPNGLHPVGRFFIKRFGIDRLAGRYKGI
ncbi:hypothetical protein SELMODRAFT_417900 [Selaginella moellendorffii]|uniref:Uncharacterized protein n=1 Tax=Selaginella moellendorffii TaxID=88036 RepID=D8S410_SELML|nr:hypothetical protein SELMODRAFT_417900 [Selaginella moellendorffii]